MADETLEAVLVAVAVRVRVEVFVGVGEDVAVTLAVGERDGESGNLINDHAKAVDRTVTIGLSGPEPPPAKLVVDGARKPTALRNV